MVSQPEILAKAPDFPEIMTKALRRQRIRWIHFIDNYPAIPVFVPETLRKSLGNEVLFTSSRVSSQKAILEFLLNAILFFFQRSQTLLQMRSSSIVNSILTQSLHEKTIGVIGYDASLRYSLQFFKDSLQSTNYLFEERGFLEFYKKSLFEKSSNFIDGAFNLDSELDQKLQEIDILINVSQKTNDKDLMTRRFIDLKSQAVVVSLGNHQNIDILGLIEALNHSKIAGAWLDFPEKGLPSGRNPLFSCRNLIVSCDLIDSSGIRLERMAKGFIENLERFSSGSLHEIKGRIDPISLRLYP